MTLPPPLATAPDAPTGLPSPPAAEGEWRPLPARALPLFVLGALPIFALAGAGLGVLLGRIAAALSTVAIGPLAAGAAGLVIGAAFGVWRGVKHYRHTHWRLDADGLAVRRGRLWQSETRVPASRVQHLDLKRGPLQRGRDLATLVVHTAGTRHSAVAVPHLDATDAEHLRERLSRQIDADDDT